MKFSFTEVCLIVLILFLTYFVVEIREDLEYASETVDLQHDAILKQKELIDFQIYYIRTLESGSKNFSPPPINRIEI